MGKEFIQKKKKQELGNGSSLTHGHGIRVVRELVFQCPRSGLTTWPQENKV